MRKVGAVVLLVVILLAAQPAGSLAELAAARVRVAGHGGGELL